MSHTGIPPLAERPDNIAGDRVEAGEVRDPWCCARAAPIGEAGKRSRLAVRRLVQLRQRPVERGVAATVPTGSHAARVLLEGSRLCQAERDQ